MSTRSVLVVDKGADAWHVTLNRPDKSNALSASLVEALLETVRQAEEANVQLLSLKGEGRNFCAGFDLAGLDSSTDEQLFWRFVRIEQLLQALNHASFTTVAFAQGRSVGAGADLLAACGYRIAESSSTFRMPGMQFGLVLGTGRLVGLIGADRARSVLHRSLTFNGEQALAMGFVQECLEMRSWATRLDELQQETQRVGETARRRLHAISTISNPHRDMAELVKSAAAPGLKARLQKYVGQALKRRQQSSAVSAFE